ncbi:MAG: hypothetical protein QM770_16105 [Tepidisphaeraceae bacterium]
MSLQYQTPQIRQVYSTGSIAIHAGLLALASILLPCFVIALLFSMVGIIFSVAEGRFDHIFLSIVLAFLSALIVSLTARSIGRSMRVIRGLPMPDESSPR